MSEGDAYLGSRGKHATPKLDPGWVSMDVTEQERARVRADRSCQGPPRPMTGPERALVEFMIEPEKQGGVLQCRMCRHCSSQVERDLAVDLAVFHFAGCLVPDIVRERRST